MTPVITDNKLGSAVLTRSRGAHPAHCTNVSSTVVLTSHGEMASIRVGWGVIANSFDFIGAVTCLTCSIVAELTFGYGPFLT